MGKAYKYFNSPKSANSFSNKVNGTPKDISQGKPGRSNYQERYKVGFETWGQSQDPRYFNGNYSDDFDTDNYTHTSGDV